MKNSASKSKNKGCFGGSMAGNKKQKIVGHTSNGKSIYKTVIASPLKNSGTVGSAMVRKLLRRRS